MRILIIEDDAEVVEAISLCLQLRWPDVEVEVATEGNEGVKMLQSAPCDIVILDINLPDIVGFEVLQRIRSFSDVPTIILTVRGKEDDQARGLEMGGDDYIIKPFRPRDLVARVNALLRRSQAPRVGVAPPRIVRGEMALDLANNETTLAGRAIRLTPTESRLLHTLMENEDDTVTYKSLSREVWGKTLENPDRLRTYIKRLRSKLHDNPPRIVLTDRRIGYKFVSPGSTSS